MIILTGILATFRLTSLLLDEDGPNNILGRFRWAMGVRYNEQSEPYSTHNLSELFVCFWCASVWVAAILALIATPRRWILNTLAWSAGAIILKERILN